MLSFRPGATAAAPPDYQWLAHQTLPGLLLERRRRDPGRIAFRAKQLGVYRETTWQEMADRVAALALALVARGLARGETVAIMGNPCPEWTLVDLASQAAGAITYGIHPTSSASELQYLLEHGGARVLVVEDQEHLDKALAVRSQCRELRSLVLVDTRTLFMYAHAGVVALSRLEGEGEELRSRQPDALAELARHVRPDDPATIVFTSGTTAHPKGAVLPHGRHIAAAATLLEHWPELRRGTHRVVAFLPLSHVMGRDQTITLPLLADIVPHYPEDVDAFAEALFEVAPTFVFTVPRYLQKIASHLLVALEATSPLKRLAYRTALRLGRAELRAHWEGRHPVHLAAGAALARSLVFRRLLDTVGLAQTRLVLSGGAPLPSPVAALWQVWGVNVLEMYGQTEAGGALIAGQQGNRPRPGDVGRAGPGIELELGVDGEILARCPFFSAGYWRDPDASAASVRAGFLATGDVGERTAAGTLRLVDRKKDFLVTAGGKNVSPTQVEGALRASRYVSEAAVFGEGRPYLVALLELDYDTVAEWARTHGVTYTGYASLVTHPAVSRLIETEVDEANRQLARVEQIKAFRVLPKELDPEQEGEPVTPTRKVKRRLMAERYRDQIESMYSEAEARRIAAALA